MRDGLLRHSEVSALRWGDVELHEDGSGRLHVARSKTDQSVEGAVIYLGPADAQTLLAIRAEEAVIDPAARIFGLSASQIGRRIRAATRLAGLGDGFTGYSPRVGMGPGPERRGCGAAGVDDGREVEQPNNAVQVHGGPVCWQRRRGSILQGRPPEMSLNRSENHWCCFSALITIEMIF